MSSLVPIIGMEVHVELKTKSKMFCACANNPDATEPNLHICPICLAHPGTLPVPNSEAIRLVALLGKALGCGIRNSSKFDRKHYFYPDLPKGYQISQFDEPIAENGTITLSFEADENPRPEVRIGIERAHLEEDTAKLSHETNAMTLVDFNRSGTPLLEIVTKPDFQTALEAKTYCQELRLLLRTLGISDADMEKGHMRCEANISVQRQGTFRIDDRHVVPVGEATLNPKVEVKNLNSFKAVEKAILYEIQRQSTLLTEGKTWGPETRGWNDAKGETTLQRVKESAADYRYFPEPDIPPFSLVDIKNTLHLPELPQTKRLRLREEYGFSISDARLFSDDVPFAEYVEAIMSELGTDDDVQKYSRESIARVAGGFLTTKLMGELAARRIDIRILKITAENMAELIGLLVTERMSPANAVKVLGEMLDHGGDVDPTHIMEERGYGLVKDLSLIEAHVDRIIASYPTQVAEYKNGKAPILQFLKGMVLRASEGTADAKTVEDMLIRKLR